MKKWCKAILYIVGIGLFLSTGAGLSLEVQAEEYEDRPVTGVDEEGNVYEVESEAGVVEEGFSTFSTATEQVVNFNTKGNATTDYVADTGDKGYTNGAYGADAAYLGTSNGQVKFLLSGVIGSVPQGDVQVINKASAKSISYYTVSGGVLKHRITTDLRYNEYASNLNCGTAPSYLKEGGQYYSYDGHYFYASDKYGAMLTDYINNNRNNSINPNTPYYNYYQYLPMRSTSSYSSSTMDTLIAGKTTSTSKMRGIGSSLTSSQNTYGVNALLTAGIAANESAWGNSNYAMQKNNLFGLNAGDSNPDDSYAYSSVSVCIKAFTETYMSKTYLNPNDGIYWGGFLGNKGSGINVKYASDPYWGEKAASMVWLLDAAGGNKDQYAYSIGIKDTFAGSHQNLLVKAGSSASSATMYSTGTQCNTSFLLLDNTAQNGFYKIASDGVLNSARTGINKDAGTYNFSSMYGYIAANSIVIVNTGRTPTGVDKFRDVNAGGWYYSYVKTVYERGIMTGMDTYTFGPAVSLSRAHFATILYRMQGSPSVSYKAVFPDVPNGYFFTSPVLWAYNNKVITGYESGKFGPSEVITREQMALMMYRYAKFCGLNTQNSANLNSYPDAGKVSDFSREAMSWAVGTGLIQGDQGTLNPQGSASRAHCATIITRFIEKYDL